MRANQLRLWFASMAYVLICALRRIGLKRTQFAAATYATIRLMLLKIGAQVRISVRRVKLAMASGYPWQREWALAHARLRNAAARAGKTPLSRANHRPNPPPHRAFQIPSVRYPGEHPIHPVFGTTPETGHIRALHNPDISRAPDNPGQTG